MNDDDFLCVAEEGILSLPFNYKLSIVTKEKIELSKLSYNKLYSKNNPHIGKGVATNLWISNYSKEKEIDKYAKQSEGINRLGVLRADVDNLGKTFVSGLPEQFNSLSRTATLSSKLSMFFKYGVDELLKKYDLLVSVIYSGGDDLFVVGAWDDIIDLGILIHDEFDRFTQSTLSISAGIGIYHAKYPIYKMASESGYLEECAKHGEKNAVSLWTDSKVYSWDVLKSNILNEKYTSIKKEFDSQKDHKKAFIYKMITLLRAKDAINIARLAYLLGRSKISDGLSKKIFKWATAEKEKEYLITALEYYIYKSREED